MDKEPSKGPLPQHMDIWSRNERLYETLINMGLVCSPIFADGSDSKIEAIHVSTGLPTEHAAQSGVGLPVKRAKVAEMVATAKSSSDNVVNFPPVG